MTKQQKTLNQLNREDSFWFKHGKFKVINLHHPEGIECELIGGQHKKLVLGETLILPRNTPVSTTKPILRFKKREY